MLTLLASIVLTRQGNPYVDSNLPPSEQTLMNSVLADYPGDPGIVCYIDPNGTAHTNKVGGLSDLVRWQPVSGQPGVYTDGTETFAGPTTDQVPPTSIATDMTVDEAAAEYMDDLFCEEGESMSPEPASARMQTLPPSYTGPYRRVVCGRPGVVGGYCEGYLAQNVNLNPQLTGAGATDSAYMYMTPWSYSKASYQQKYYWTTAGDFGFKFSHVRRS